MSIAVRLLRRIAAAGALVAAVPIALGSVGRTDGSNVFFGPWRFPLACAFKAAYGIPCATCGMTRGWIAAIHGRFAEARAFNGYALETLGATMVLAVALAVVASLARRSVRGALVLGVAAALLWAVAWAPVVQANRALFANALALRQLLLDTPDDRALVLDLRHARYVDLSVLSMVDAVRRSRKSRSVAPLEVVGLDAYANPDAHPLSTRRTPRAPAATPIDS